MTRGADVSYNGERLVKRSRALLASNPTRDSQVRAGEWTLLALVAPATRAFLREPFICPVMPQKTQFLHPGQVLRTPTIRRAVPEIPGRTSIMWCGGSSKLAEGCKHGSASHLSPSRRRKRSRASLEPLLTMQGITDIFRYMAICRVTLCAI